MNPSSNDANCPDPIHLHSMPLARLYDMTKHSDVGTLLQHEGQFVLEKGTSVQLSVLSARLGIANLSYSIAITLWEYSHMTLSELQVCHMTCLSSSDCKLGLVFTGCRLRLLLVFLQECAAAECQ